MENRLLLKHMIETLRMTHEIEIRDKDNCRLFNCQSNSQALEPYLNREVVEWFVYDNKAVILIGEELIEYCDTKDVIEENKIPIGLWYEDTDKRKPSEEMIYRKPSGEEYMWKDDIWVRIK